MKKNQKIANTKKIIYKIYGEDQINIPISAFHIAS